MPVQASSSEDTWTHRPLFPYGHSIHSPSDPDNFEEVRKALEDAGIPMISAEVTMIPQNYVTLTDETAVKNLQRTLELLEDDDDVQAVYHNWDE